MPTSPILATKLTRTQLLETGLLMVLLVLIFSFIREEQSWLVAGIIGTIIALVAPQLYYPIGVVWFTLGNLLGRVMPPLLLSLVFLLLVSPVGMVRRWLGHDSLHLTKKLRSTLRERNHTFTAGDLKHPF